MTNSTSGNNVKNSSNLLLHQLPIERKKRMKKLLTVVVAVLVSLSFAGASLAAEQTLVTDSSTKKPSVKKERLVTETATVEAIDLDTRVVTLKSSRGMMFDVKAGAEVRNLAQVKVGDRVKTIYYQSVAIEVMAPGQAPGGIQKAVAKDRAKLGEKPAGMIGEQMTVTAKVEAIDKKKSIVTLKGPEGKTLIVKVEQPKNMKNVNVGDEVVITLTEALAISVEAVK